MPSNETPGRERISCCKRAASCRTAVLGSLGVARTSCESKCALMSAVARIVLEGRISMTMMARCGIQLEVNRTPAARQPAEQALHHPAFADQRVHNRRDRAPLQPRRARQIGPGNRLATPDEIQDDAAIDVPRRLAGCCLQVVEIDLPHGRERAHDIPIVKAESIARKDATTRADDGRGNACSCPAAIPPQTLFSGASRSSARFCVDKILARLI